MQHLTNHVILSAERPKFSAYENFLRTKKLLKRLFDAGFSNPIVAEGRYRGKAESSVIVKLDFYESDLKALKVIAAEFEQESILEVNANTHGYLHFVDKTFTYATEEYLGVLKYLQGTDGVENYTILPDGRKFTFTR